MKEIERINEKILSLRRSMRENPPKTISEMIDKESEIDSVRMLADSVKENVERYTIAKFEDGHYEMHAGYVPLVSEWLSSIYVAEITEDHLSKIRKAKTKEEVDSILSKYL